MQANTTIGALMMATALAGCSTKPRNFAAQVAVPSEELVAFEDNYRTCSTLVAQGHRSGFRDAALTLGASGAGAVAGVGVALGTAGLIAGSGPWAGLAAAGTAASVAVPGLGLLVGFGASRMIRGGNERRFRQSMSACLGEFGYEVDGWERIERKADAAAAARSMVLARPTRPAADAVQPEQDVVAAQAWTDPVAETDPMSPSVGSAGDEVASGWSAIAVGPEGLAVD